MWTKQLWRAALIGLALSLTLAGMASAGKDKPCDPWPSCNTTTTTDPAPSAPWTCVARARNGGTAWVIGEWVSDDGGSIEYFDRDTLEGDPTSDLPVPDHYRTYVDERSGVPACFDIHPAHVNLTNWRVEWDPAPGSSTSAKGKLGGLLMQFEREVHSDVYWEYIARSVESGVCETDPAACTPQPDQEVSSWTHPDGVIDTLVFVAMPSHRDHWVFDGDHRLTVTPLGDPILP